MKKILEIVTEELSKAFEACGYEKTYGKAGISNRPDLCEYQCNGAMAGAKAYKKAPIMIANEVVEKLQKNPFFDEVVAVMPGFINMKISGEFLAGYMNDMAADEKLGCQMEETPKTIIIDFGGANAAKPLHVGHLRSAVIGESVKRTARYFGNNVIGDVHLGDWGLQMGLIIEELHERKPELVYFDESYSGEYPAEPPFTISELEEIYPAASARAKEDEAFAERAHTATFRLQNGDQAYTAIWNHIMGVSKKDLKKNYDNLKVSFDLWKGESDAQPYIPDMIQGMLDRKVAYESQGAVVIDVAEETDTKEIPPCLIRKSDGAALYATSDLATILEREKLYQPDEYIYVVDKRQELYFTQMFRAARKAGLVKRDASLNFLGFGTMNGKDGKPFKTRAGGVMRLESLISDISEAVYQKMAENAEKKEEALDEEATRRTAAMIGLSALKYGDLSNQASKDYIFDVDKFTSFEGNTGPYILYTIVRIKSIMTKYKEKGGDVGAAVKMGVPVNESEKALMLTLSKFNDTLENAYRDIAPHKICQYIYDLSNDFNHFYHETKIIGEEDKARQSGWIALLKLTIKTLEQGIELLGFEAPDRM